MFGSQRLSRAVALISSRCRYLELRWYRPAPPNPTRLYLLSSERSGRSSFYPLLPPRLLKTRIGFKVELNHTQVWMTEDGFAAFDDFTENNVFEGRGGSRFIKLPACFGTRQTSITDRLPDGASVINTPSTPKTELILLQLYGTWAVFLELGGKVRFKSNKTTINELIQ